MGIAVPLLLACTFGLSVVCAAQTSALCRLTAYRRDPLSGLFVRRAWERGLRGASRRGRRTHPGHRLAVVMADIDDMRRHNAHGHDGGDRAIRAVGRRARRSALAHVGRIGGDEIAGLLWVAPDADPSTVAAEVEAALATSAEAPSGQAVPVTVSVGVAVVGQEGRSVASAIDNASRHALTRKAAKRQNAAAVTQQLPKVADAAPVGRPTLAAATAV